MPSKDPTPTVQQPKTLLVVLHTPYNASKSPQEYRDEFIHLARSNNIRCDAIVEATLRSVDNAYFLTKGKLAELAEACSTAHYELVIISEHLSPHQARSLASFLRCDIMDRTDLILSIFEARATSAEGKLQVSLAVLQHKKSRLAGRGIHLSQQGGRIGTRGPGETAKERDLQHINHLMHRIRKELGHLERVRATQRKQRLYNNVPLICLIGYTNAGKSSIFNRLTKSNVLADDHLFATLDTTTHELYVHKQKIGLLSDTVGFIQNLPPSLIDAFKSTLHELSHAHLLIHVIDVSHEDWQVNKEVVERILTELDIDKPTLYVLNKADKLAANDHPALLLKLPLEHPAIFTSATTESGLDELKKHLTRWHETRSHETTASEQHPHLETAEQ